MNQIRGGRGAPSHLKVAVYDMPLVVGRRLAEAAESAGHSVLFEGPLNARTARSDADVWLTKWSFGLSHGFLSEFRPRLGFVSATSGVDHIDRDAVSEYGLRAERCPTFSSRSVAEHALALAFKASYSRCSLPPLSAGPLMVSGYSDDFAGEAVAHMLMRDRNMDESVSCARSFSYLEADGRRPSGPWENRELSGSRIGFVGRGRPAYMLAHILKSGFDCELWGHDVPNGMAAFNVRLSRLDELLEKCRYIFVCDDRQEALAGAGSAFPAARLELPENSVLRSSVAVLGTGAIGSIIARICRLGFDCDVRAFSRSMKQELLDLGVRYPNYDSGHALASTLRGTDFVFAAVPGGAETANFLPEKGVREPFGDRRPVLVNITRDRIIDSEALYALVWSGHLSAYATDVMPGDFSLCKGEKPGHIARMFAQSPLVVPTPHIAECSRESLGRLVAEALSKLDDFLAHAHR